MNAIIQEEKPINSEIRKHKRINMENAEKILKGLNQVIEGKVKRA